jgi:hypothetical protein
MPNYEVEKMYEEGVKDYDEEFRFDVTPSGPVLALFFNKTSSKEINSINSGKVELGFYERREEGVLFLLAKFEGMVWMDAAYSVHLVDATELYDLKESGVQLQIILVNAKNGIVKAIRTVELPDRFSQKLKEALDEQKSKPFNAGTYYETVGSLYHNFPTKDLVKRADVLYRFK